MSSKVYPSSTENDDGEGGDGGSAKLQYSPSMFDAAAKSNQSRKKSNKEGNVNGSLLPSTIIGVNPTIKFTNPAFCGYACARRFDFTDEETSCSTKQKNQFIGIDSLAFIYEFNSKPLPKLQSAFEEKFASLHLYQFRYSCIGGVIAMTLLGGYDWYYYREEEHFTALMLLRFLGFLPCLIIACCVTYSKQYWITARRNLFLTTLSFSLGVLIVIYSFITMGANQGTFALYFAMLFFLTPINFSRQLIVGVTLWFFSLVSRVLVESSKRYGNSNSNTFEMTELFINFEILQSWSTLLASLILYCILRYNQVQHLAVDTVKIAFLARNRDAAKEEREKGSELLLSCLPASIIQKLEEQNVSEMKLGGGEKDATKKNTTKDTKQFARHHDSVTVLFCQICNIDSIVNVLNKTLGHRRGSTALVIILNSIFTSFDQIMDRSNCKKIETVMDVYMAVCGCPDDIKNHADLAAYCACMMMGSKSNVKNKIASELRKSIDGLIAPWKLKTLVNEVCNQFDIHIGLNSGSVNSGVIGKTGPRFKIFGDVVNTASRMESTAPYGIIQCSKSTSDLITNPLFQCTEQKPIEVKGKGEMRPYYVNYTGKNILQEEPLLIIIPAINEENSKEKGVKPRTRSETRRSSTSVLRNVSDGNSITSSSSSITDNEHLNDYIIEYYNKYPMKELLSGTRKPILTSSQYTSMGFYGSPVPFFKYFCACCSTQQNKNGSNVGIPDVIKEYHKEQESRYEKQQSPHQMASLRKLAILSIIVASCLCWLDINRYNSYISNGYCNHFTSITSCSSLDHLSNHPNYDNSNLCYWNATLSTCNRNTSVLSDSITIDESGCQWIYEINSKTHEYGSMYQLRAELQLFYSLAVRFVGVSSFSIVLIFLSYKKWFNNHPFGQMQQIVGGVLVFGLGVCVSCLSWLSGSPEVGTVTCYIFLALVTSNVRYFYRMFILLSLSVIFGIILYFYNPYKSDVSLCTDPIQFIGTRVLFMLFSILSAGVPIAKKEAWGRKDFGRKETITHSEILLNTLLLKTRGLLSALLPPHVVALLATQQRHERKAIAEYYSSVSIIFTDMKGFTKFSSTVTPSELVVFLNNMYNRFDEISELCSIFKVEIIGDAYFGCAGAPTQCEDHTDKIARAALSFIDSVEQMKIDTPALARANVQIRIGVHSGGVVAGVVGEKDPRYHLFGTNVSYAESMESSGVPGKIQASDDFATEVELYNKNNKRQKRCEYKLTLRGDITIPKAGTKKTWFIERYNNSSRTSEFVMEPSPEIVIETEAKTHVITTTSSIAKRQKNKPVKKISLGRNATFPSSDLSRSKSINSNALAAWDEDH